MRGARKTCAGQAGWIEPDTSKLRGMKALSKVVMVQIMIVTAQSMNHLFHHRLTLQQGYVMMRLKSALVVLDGLNQT